MMKNFQIGLFILLLTVFSGCTTTSNTYPTTAFPERPGLVQSGTFTVREDQILRLNTGASGEGHLIFQGWEHTFAFEGGKITVLGGGTSEIEGAVYNLEKVEDFAGNYEPVGADFEAGEGLSGAWGKNENGVVVYVRYHGRDIEINREAIGLKVTLK